MVDTTQAGHNLTEVKAQLKDKFDAIKEMETKRADVNAKISEIRESLPALGIPKEAFDIAVRYMGWDEDKRRGFDFAYQLVREAIGAPLQMDMEEWLNAREKDDGGEGEGDDGEAGE